MTRGVVRCHVEWQMPSAAKSQRWKALRPGDGASQQNQTPSTAQVRQAERLVAVNVHDQHQARKLAGGRQCSPAAWLGASSATKLEQFILPPTLPAPSAAVTCVADDSGRESRFGITIRNRRLRLDGSESGLAPKASGVNPRHRPARPQFSFQEWMRSGRPCSRTHYASSKSGSIMRVPSLKSHGNWRVRCSRPYRSSSN